MNAPPTWRHRRGGSASASGASSIASRPVYGTLSTHPGRNHLMIADAEGAEAVLDIATPELMSATHLIYIPKGSAFTEELRGLAPAQFYAGPSYAAALPRIRRVLGDAVMGLQGHCRVDGAAEAG